MRRDVYSRAIEEQPAWLPFGTPQVEASDASLRHLGLRVIRQHVRQTREGVVLRHARPMAGEQFPLGRPTAPFEKAPLEALGHAHRYAPVLLIRVPTGVPPKTLEVGQIGVGKRTTRVLAEGPPWPLNGTVPTRLIRRARRDMHAPSVAHGFVLSHDEIWRVVTVQTSKYMHANALRPREVQVGALGGFRPGLPFLQVELVETGPIVMIAADRRLPTVNVPDGD